MGQVKGGADYDKFMAGKVLTRGKAIIAKCYECNGFSESGVDCEIPHCPLYPYHPHNPSKIISEPKRGGSLSKNKRKKGA